MIFILYYCHVQEITRFLYRKTIQAVNNARLIGYIRRCGNLEII
jgi:hypothetical protein